MKYKYQDKVKITDGFFEGYKGAIVGYKNLLEGAYVPDTYCEEVEPVYVYKVRLEDGSSVQIDEINLKIIK